MKFNKHEGELFSSFDLKRLIGPLIIEQTLAITVGMFDSMMVSSLGDSAVSGVSLVDMINAVMIYVFSALATGGAVVVSRFVGAKRAHDAQKTVRQLFFVSLAVSLGIMVLCIGFRDPLLRLIFGNVEADVMRASRSYFLITALSFPVLAVYNACAAVFRAIGNSKISMQVSLASNLLNIAGNALLIYVFKWGVAGAALSTLFARAFAMVFLLVKLSMPGHVLTTKLFAPFKPDRNLIWQILYIGIPSGIENGMFHLGRLLVVRIVTLFGTAAIAANSVANTLCGVGCIAGSACSLAMVTVIGQCVGNGDMDVLRSHAKRMMKIVYLLGIGFNFLVLVTLPITMRLYNVSSEATRLAVELILLHGICAILFWPASFTMPNILRAAGDVKFTMLVSVGSMVLCRIVLSFVFGKYLGWGVIGVWVAMICDWLVRIAFFVRRLLSGKWENFARRHA